MGYQESWMYVPQDLFNNYIQRYKEMDHRNTYAEICSIVILKRPIHPFPANTKIIWISGDRGYHDLETLFGKTQPSDQRAKLIQVEEILDFNDPRLEGLILSDDSKYSENAYFKRYSLEHYIQQEKKAKQAEQVQDITDRLKEGIQQLFESDRYKAYLTTMAKFHNYSFNNTLLIAMQKPDATLVAGYSDWKNKFGRHVKRGEKGIKIFAPMPYKGKKEQTKLDPITQKPVLDAEGNQVKEVVETTYVAYKVVTVFDINQTEGKELPTIGVAELGGDVVNYDKMLEGLRQVSPVPIGFEEIAAGAKGYYSPAESRIAIQQGMSELQTIKTAIHEIAHAKLHAVTPDEKAAPEDKKDRRTKEVEAESIAYTVCQHFGIDTSDYSFGYVAGWSSGKEMKELRASMEVIRGTAHEIILELDGHMGYRDLQREITQAQPREEKARPKRKSPAKAAGRKKKTYSYER